MNPYLDLTLMQEHRTLQVARVIYIKYSFFVTLVSKLIVSAFFYIYQVMTDSFFILLCYQIGGRNPQIC